MYQLWQAETPLDMSSLQEGKLERNQQSKQHNQNTQDMNFITSKIDNWTIVSHQKLKKKQEEGQSSNVKTQGYKQTTNGGHSQASSSELHNGGSQGQNPTKRVTGQKEASLVEECIDIIGKYQVHTRAYNQPKYALITNSKAYASSPKDIENSKARDQQVEEEPIDNEEQ